MNKKDAVKIELSHDSDIDDIVNALALLVKISPKEYYVEFNGHIIYADINFKVDNAYKQVFGKTREEFLEERDNSIAEIDRRIKKFGREARALLEERFEKGKKYIYPERQEEWRRLLTGLTSGILDEYHAKYPDLMIECLEKLESGEKFQSVLDFIKEVRNGSIGLVAQVLPFSKVGPEFYEYVHKEIGDFDNLPKYHKERLKTIKEENAILAKRHGVGREISINEVTQVAEMESRTNRDNAMDAVTGPKGKNRDVNSHNNK